jgi:hypothetical protein
MGRQVLKQEFADRSALIDEFKARTSEAMLNELFAKLPEPSRQNANGLHNHANN